MEMHCGYLEFRFTGRGGEVAYVESCLTTETDFC